MRTKKTMSLIVLLCGMAALNGCAKDISFLPPAENEYVTVRIKVPAELKAEEMQVMYRSSICKQATYDSNGNRSDVDGYHGFDTSLQRKGETDLYEVKLPRNGGGECRWNLSNVTFGVVHGTPDIYGAGVIAGGGGGVVVAFDKNNNQRGGSGIFVKSDLVVKKDYYPWISEGFLGGYRKVIKITNGIRIYKEYYAPEARLVYFEPVFHADFILKSQGPKVKRDGVYTTYTYPDGSVYSDGKWHPNMSRLQAIRLAAEAKK